MVLIYWRPLQCNCEIAQNLLWPAARWIVRNCNNASGKIVCSIWPFCKVECVSRISLFYPLHLPTLVNTLFRSGNNFITSLVISMFSLEPFAWVAWRHNPRRAQWLYYEYVRCTCPWIFKHDKRARNGETDRACAKLQTVKLFLERQIGVTNVLRRLDKLSTRCQGLYLYVITSFMGSVTALKREELFFPNGNNFIKTASTRFLHCFHILTSKMMGTFNFIFTLKQIGWQTRL